MAVPVSKKSDEKRKIRQEMLQKRDVLPAANRVIHSATILQRLFELEVMQMACWVTFYASYGSEVETGGMMAHALAHGKRVSVPKIEGGNRILLSELRHPVRELAPGWRGIPEPRSEFLRPVKIEAMDFVVVPGVAYDDKGNRLGQGGGCYDQLLAKVRGRIPIVALAFELQLTCEVPVLPNDVPVDFIVTERRVIDCREKGM